MIRIALAELRRQASIWLGAFFVAVACGFIGSWSAALMSNASLSRGLADFGTTVLIFSVPSALAVLAAVSKLTVSAQRSSFALWQLAGITPRQVTRAVLMQLGIVAVVGAACGTVLELGVFRQSIPLVFSSTSYEAIAELSPNPNPQVMPLVWLAVAVIFLLGGWRSAAEAGRTPALSALREPSPPVECLSLSRISLLAASVIIAASIAHSLFTAQPTDSAWECSVFLPLASSAALGAAAPALLPAILNAWSRLVPKRWNIWFLARTSAQYRLEAGNATETPIAVSCGIVGGILSLTALLKTYLDMHGIVGINVSLDFTSFVLLLGGPILLAVIGATASVAMSACEHMRDTATLVACGASPVEVIAAACLEALVHTINAMLAGTIVTIISSAVFSLAAGMPPLTGIALPQVIVVASLGGCPLFAATVIPVVRALVCISPSYEN